MSGKRCLVATNLIECVPILRDGEDEPHDEDGGEPTAATKMRANADQTDGSNGDKNHDALEGMRSESIDGSLQRYLGDAVDVEGS